MLCPSLFSGLCHPNNISWNGSGSDAKKDYRTKTIGRRKGRRLLRRMHDVVADLKVMKIKQWMEMVKDREKWRLIVEVAKAHPGL